MYDVTDAAFRRIIARYGKPDVFFTEFVSVEGLASPARKKLLREFAFSEAEHPIVAQIFGIRPENYERAAALAASLGFDGVDINIGCPDRAVMKQGSCAALIGDPVRAKEIIAAAKAGASSGIRHLPVSVKTRIGIKKIVTEEWIKALLDAKPAVITVHGRTAVELSKVPAHWDEIGKAAALAAGTGTLIIGNGDVRDLSDAREKAARYGVDGIMLGRAVFGNPWLFSEQIPSCVESLRALIEHARLFEELFGPDSRGVHENGWSIKNWSVMKKHFKAYVRGFLGAHELRERLMETDTAGEVAVIVGDFLKKEKDPVVHGGVSG